MVGRKNLWGKNHAGKEEKAQLKYLIKAERSLPFIHLQLLFRGRKNCIDTRNVDKSKCGPDLAVKANYLWSKGPWVDFRQSWKLFSTY